MSPYPPSRESGLGCWTRIFKAREIKKGCAKVKPIRHSRGKAGERNGHHNARQAAQGNSKRRSGFWRCSHDSLMAAPSGAGRSLLSNAYKSSEVRRDRKPLRNRLLTHHRKLWLILPLVDSGGRCPYAVRR